ncbi:hypothetical protein BCD67_13695 [Oscillatoriales cyanobacterium USR001]|nr:hypothetical protein BCD67_13695 [Oscillatoriales cyanobacterium USR001]
MSEQVLSSETQAPETSDSEPRIGAEFVELLQEIQETPREHWPNLLQMIRLFKETVTMKPRVSEKSDKIDITKLSLEERIKRNQGAIDLINSWVDEGDEEEQTETWEYLCQAIDRDRLSNRPLFP